LDGADEGLGPGAVETPPIELVPPSDDGLDGAHGFIVGIVLGAALWLILLAPVVLGRFFRAVKFD